jgi:hypothetical protein
MKRWAVGAAAVAAAVVGAAGVLVLTRHDGGSAAAPVRDVPPPEWYLALASGQPRLYAAAGDRQLEVPFDVRFEPSDTAAVGDGRTFYVLLGEDCRRQRFLKVVVEDGRVRTAPVDGDVTPGGVFSFAVSPDGRTLAYARFHRTRECSPVEDKSPELVVRDLATGRTRTWTAGAATGGEPPRYLGSLSFSPDGRRIAYDVGHGDGVVAIHVLDTGAPGDSYVTARPIGREAPAPDGRAEPCALLAPAYRGKTGELLAIRACREAGAPSRGVDVVVVDPGTGAVRGTLFALPPTGATRLEPDASGQHVFAEETAADGEAVHRWDGRTLREVDPRPGSQVSW